MSGVAGRVVPREGSALRLFLLSFLSLFTELALIRWTAENDVYLSLFTNFILLASFLGIGLGFMVPERWDLWRRGPILLAGLALFTALLPVRLSGPAGHRLFYGLNHGPALPRWILLPIMFVGSVAVMAAIGQGVARTFRTFAPLSAYRLDILGSIAGVAGFSLLAFLSLPPVVWGCVVAALFVLLQVGRRGFPVQALVAGVVLIVILAVQSLSPTDRWSPYYRISVSPSGDLVNISVNSIPHQSIRPLSELRAPGSFYLLPYANLNGWTPKNVLIVGAGTGNDVAVALSEGVRHVDAVEIDPELYRIGRQMNPAHPYQDPRVTVHIDDGRAFLERSTQKWDLILFALPDSLTLLTGQGNVRLESYVLTIDAMRAAHDHLAPGGAFAMYNYYRPFEYQRLGSSLSQVFGRHPCVGFGNVRGDRKQAVLVEGQAASAVSCSQTWQPTGFVPAPATDDHPFPYLPRPSIPAMYVWALLAILAFSALTVRGAIGSLKPIGRYLDLFFMGAAFLLLETKSVVQFALLFGTTWFVNALVFAGVLLAVLAAIEVARRMAEPRMGILYTLLFAAIALAWIVPPEDLLSLAVVPRFFASVALAFAPVFLANLVFAQRFREAESSTFAFGANLLGAMLGGALEYLSLITGYRALLLVVALLYALAFVTTRRLRERAGEPPAPPEAAVVGAGGGDTAP